MANDTTYNGWTNYETWCVKLWIDNDEGSYLCWLDNVKDVLKRADDKDEAIGNLREMLKDEHEESQPEVSGVYADLMTAALGSVDWYEIASAMITDYLADNPEDDPEYEEAEAEEAEAE